MSGRISVRSLLVFVSITTAIVSAQSPFRGLGAVFPPTVGPPERVADIDGDGRPDVVFATNTLLGSDVAVNDGTGVGFTKQSFGSLVLGYSGRVADLNGDGLPDLVDTEGVKLQSPAPAGFALAQAFVAPTSPIGPSWLTALDLGDVDADGDLDAVAASTIFNPLTGQNTPGPVAVWLNGGLGVFTVAPAGAAPATGVLATQCLVRDFDGDGDVDALLGNGPTAVGPALLLTNSGGVLSPSPLPAPFGVGISELVAADFDGDGRLDLAGLASSLPTPAIAVALNGPAGFGPATTSTLPSPPSGVAAVLGMTAVDTDADGKAELVTSIDASGVEVRSVGPTGAVGIPTRAYAGMFLAPVAAAFDAGSLRDFDGDGDVDLLAATSRGRYAVLFNDGVGGFVPVGDETLPSKISDPVFGDFDGDGKLDAFSRPATLIGGIGDAWSPGPAAVPMPNYRFIAIDGDADGDDDLYGLSPGGSAFWPDYFCPSVGAAFAPAPLPWFTAPVSSATVADVDADGDEDLLIGRRALASSPPGTPTTTLLLRNVGGALTAPVAIGANAGTFAVVTGDFDADGLVDLLQVNQGGALDPTYVYSAVGAAPVPIAQSGIGGYAAVADLDGDGSTDAAVGTTIYRSTAGVLTPVGALPSMLMTPGTFADVDADGDLDLVDFYGQTFLRSALWTFSPPTTWSFTPNFSVTPLTRPVLADADRDGDLDLYGPGPRVHFNLARQLTHGKPVRIGYGTSVDVYGSVGSTALLFAAPNVADYFAAPGLRVLIDPATAQFITAVPLGVAGSLSPGFGSLPVAVPNLPALVGLSLHWQAIETTQNRLTNRLTSTVLSF